MCNFRYYLTAFLMLSCLSLAYAVEVEVERKCPEGQVIEEKCPAGQVFDEVTKMCKDIPTPADEK